MYQVKMMLTRTNTELAPDVLNMTQAKQQVDLNQINVDFN
jgi:hypothetical protein